MTCHISVEQSLKSQREHDQKEFFLELEAYQAGFQNPHDGWPPLIDTQSLRNAWRQGRADYLAYNGHRKN